MLMREIGQTREEVTTNSVRYEKMSHNVSEIKSLVGDYENRLRYANEVISGLETENQQLELDIA